MAEIKITSDENIESIEANTESNLTDAVDNASNGQEKCSLTKSQLKKLKKKEKWQLVKAEKRKAEKERQKARKKACRERGEELGPSRKKLSKNTMEKSSCKIRVAIDCDFDEYMAEKDIKMLVKQIQYSYSANRRAESPMQFYCCGVGNKTKERLESIGDYKGWDIYFHHESYLEKFEKSSVVYLSSESQNVLQELDEDKVYIIGGLVDHNHHKGLCHKLAEEKGLYHAQLPISEYIDMKTRKVLTINHVFEILLRYTETKDWQKAFYTVLPSRKGAVLKTVDSVDKGSPDNTNDTAENLTRLDDKRDNLAPQERIECDVAADLDKVTELGGSGSVDEHLGDTLSDSDKESMVINKDIQSTEKDVRHEECEFDVKVEESYGKLEDSVEKR